MEIFQIFVPILRINILIFTTKFTWIRNVCLFWDRRIAMILTYIELKKQQDKLWLFSFNALNVHNKVIFNNNCISSIVKRHCVKEIFE